MVPDVAPPPPPPMPSAAYVPPKPALAIVKSEKSTSPPPRNPIATNDSFDSVISEIKNKGGTLRKTKRKEVVRMEECVVPQVNLKSVPTAKPTFRNEIIVNIAPAQSTINVVGTKSTATNDVTDGTANINGHCTNGGTLFQLRRPSEFLNGKKPEVPATKKEVPKPHLAPKVFVNGTKPDSKSTASGTVHRPSPQVPPPRRPSLVSSTIQRLTSTEPDSPAEAPPSPFKRNRVLTRSTSGGINSTVQKLERQTSHTHGTAPVFQRSNSVRQRITQMNQVEKPHQNVKDGTQSVGRRPLVPRPKLPRPSNATIKFVNDLNNASVGKGLHNDNVRLENGDARVGTTVNVADLTGTVTVSDPTVKKLVYGTYRNFLGAYNNKANDMVTNQSDTMVVQDRGVGEQLRKLGLNGNVNGLTGRALRKTED